ncbi:MAG: hypothetical protein M1286_03865 [Candidatus Marsarchaeota archaeon]|nr:hypothetical protein [Candidatus Marsarchaeota archaeon]
MLENTKVNGHSPSLISLFDRVLEVHPLKLSELQILIRPGTTYADLAESTENRKRELFVADLDKSKDKSLFWIKSGTERMIHEYLKREDLNYASAIFEFRFESTERMAAKLRQVYEEKRLSPSILSYVAEDNVWVGFRKAHFALDYNKPTGYFTAHLSDYDPKDDAKAIAVMRFKLSKIESVTGREEASDLC